MFTPSLVAGGAKFVCGDSDLDEFFHEDAFLQAGQLLCKNYCFTSDENPNEVVCAFTLANDSIKKILRWLATSCNVMPRSSSTTYFAKRWVYERLPVANGIFSCWS